MRLRVIRCEKCGGSVQLRQGISSAACDKCGTTLRLVEALRGGGPVPVDPRDAVASLTIVEAAQQSAEEGSVVVLR